MTYASITSMVRNWFYTEPPHPVTEPRVYGTMPELARVTAERDELRIALGTEERAHEAAAERCRELTGELDICRTANRSLANEVRALNELLARGRRKYRRSRKELAAALESLQEAVTELEKRKQQGGAR
jgi:chromosome segregation ATPase